MGLRLTRLRPARSRQGHKDQHRRVAAQDEGHWEARAICSQRTHPPTGAMTSGHSVRRPRKTGARGRLPDQTTISSGKSCFMIQPMRRPTRRWSTSRRRHHQEVQRWNRLASSTSRCSWPALRDAGEQQTEPSTASREPRSCAAQPAARDQRYHQDRGRADCADHALAGQAKPASAL